VNLNNDRAPITIKRGEPLIHIEFITRIGEPSPYMGSYMFQYMTDEEVSLYLDIIKDNFGKEMDRERLKELARARIVA